MHKLKFMNPVGLRSENFTTVRFGLKWAERTVPADDGTPVTVELVGPKDEPLGTAAVIDAWVGRLMDLPSFMIECEHDPVCRTWSGVAQVLAGCYPDEKINFKTKITALRLCYLGEPKIIAPSREIIVP